MKALVLFLSVVALCACEFNGYEATNETYQNGQLASRKRVREVNSQLGGTRSGSRSDGSSYGNDYQTSLRDGMTGLPAVYAAKAAPVINAQNQTAKMYQTQAGATAGQVPTVTQPASVAPGTTVFPLVTPPPSIPVPPLLPTK